MDVRNRFGSRATRLYCAYLGVMMLLGGCQTGKTLVSEKSHPASPPPHIREIEYPDVNIPPALRRSARSSRLRCVGRSRSSIGR